MPRFSAESPASSTNAKLDLPVQPARCEIDSMTAMPSACAREHGDYSDGDYAVAVLTRDAPDAESSNFSQVLRDRSCG